MKKILILLILMLPFLLGQTIVYYDVVPIAWDAVASMADSVITYEVIRAPADTPMAFEIVAEISGTSYDVPLMIEGEWIVGIRTVRTINSTGDRLLSDINWSNVDGLWTPEPFICRYFLSPEMPTNMRLR